MPVAVTILPVPMFLLVVGGTAGQHERIAIVDGAARGQMLVAVSVAVVFAVKDLAHRAGSGPVMVGATEYRKPLAVG